MKIDSGAAAPVKNMPGIKVILFRMWAAGAVCFFGGWGRGASEKVGGAYSIDLIAGLIVFIILSDWIIVEPVLRLIINKKSKAGRTENGNKAVGRIFSQGILHILRVTFSVLLIVVTYYLLNTFFIRLFGLDEEAVPVPLEPLLFGVLYGLYYLLFCFVKQFFLRRRGAPDELL